LRILVGGWFTLPRLGTEEFRDLMKRGVTYDRAMGFRLEPGTDIEGSVRAIEAATGEEVELTLRCFVCGKEACPGCPYLDTCDRTKVSSLCLCADHGPERDVFELYRKTLAETLAS
jgi:hypothetical protein